MSSKESKEIAKYFSKESVKRTFFNFLVITFINIIYLIALGNIDDVPFIEYIFNISKLGIFSICLMWFMSYISTISDITQGNHLKYLDYYKYVYEKKGTVSPISDEIIIQYIKNKQKYILGGLTLHIFLFICDSNMVTMEFGVLLSIAIYFFLEFLFLSDSRIKQVKTFNKYRDIFPKEENSK